MFFIHELRSTLNVQSDSIRAKVFIRFLLVFFLACFDCPFTLAKIFFILLMCKYIFLFFYFIIHLIMTEARSKRRVLLLVCFVKCFRKPLLI